MDYRTIDRDEVDAFLTTLVRAFGDVIPDPDQHEADVARLEPDRSFAAIDDGAIVGCAGAFSWGTTVPGGGDVATTCITTVGVLPTHRRRGVTTELLRRLLLQATEREEPLATLFASEGAIYGRFGFGLATSALSFDILTSRAVFAPGFEPYGRTVLLPREEALPLMKPVFDAVVRTRPGANPLDDADFAWFLTEETDAKKGHFYAVHEDADGAADAYAVYRVKHRWPRGLPHAEMKVRQLMASNGRAGAAMWRFVFDVDLVSSVRVFDRPVDDPLLLQLAEPRAARARLYDGMFARPVDVAAALSSRSYATDGTLRIELTDPFVPAVTGTYELSIEGGEARCVRTDAVGDLACRVNAIGATYLGGSAWSAVAAAGLVHERTPGALARADAMFASAVAPWTMWDF